MRALELSLSAAVIIYALILLIPNFPDLWKGKVLPLTLALLAWLKFPLFSASQSTAPCSFRLPMWWGSSR